MNLNPDCVRDVLIYLKDNLILFEDNHRVCRNDVSWKTISTDSELNSKYQIEEIQYAILQLGEADFIRASSSTGGKDRGILSLDILDITWTGHELLANLRGEELWKATKSIANKLGTCSIKALAAIASAVINAKINQYFQGAQP